MAQVMGQTADFVQMLAAADAGRIPGVQILGHRAEALILEAIVAIAFRATAEPLSRNPHYQPTPPEIPNYLAEELTDALRRRCTRTRPV